MNDNDPILLILDVDETLIYATEQPLAREPDFAVGPYSVYRRPFLTEFLQVCRQDFRLAVWSSSSADYLEGVLREILPFDLAPLFVWSRERCTRRIDPERYETVFVKDLKKVKRKGFDLARVLIVDDTAQKADRNYGNAVYVTPFFGDPADDELRPLSLYLKALSSMSDVRSIEKRQWRNRR